MSEIKELSSSHKDIERIELLGIGTFGRVYRAKRNREDIAIKILQIESNEFHTLFREIYFLNRFKAIKCPYIIEYYDSYIYNTSELWILMEYCDCGSLSDINEINKKKQINFIETELQAIITCCILGLVHIHQYNSIHRDIKASNLLLSSTGRVLISDFSVSTKGNKPSPRTNTGIYEIYIIT